jgi:hypothetical protein
LSFFYIYNFDYFIFYLNKDFEETGLIGVDNNKLNQEMPQSAAIQEKLKKFEHQTTNTYNRQNDYEQNRNFEFYKQQNQINDNQQFLLNNSNNEKNNQRLYSYGENKQIKRGGLFEENRVSKYFFSQLFINILLE